MKFEVEGEIGYAGPDDPPADYYYFYVKTGEKIYIGFDVKEFDGDIYNGIPGFPKDYTKCKLTIEFIE